MWEVTVSYVYIATALTGKEDIKLSIEIKPI